MSIGRGRGNHIWIEGEIVSRQHATLHLLRDRVEIQDLASTGGTWLNRGPTARTADPGERYAERLVPHARVRLALDDTLSIGGSLLSLRPATAPPMAHAMLEARTNVLRSPGLAQAYELATRAAATELPVLILGETGVGKQVMAEFVHRHSRRAAGPFTVLNCAALSKSLMESELFGRRGAVTGPQPPKRGLLEASRGGTIFLDEIGELPLGAQARLLRMLEKPTTLGAGTTASQALDVRVVSATHCDLRRRVRQGRFRSDLYYRINAVAVHIPPLRERLSEVEPLARHFIGELCKSLVQPPAELSPAAVEVLRGYTWPGNVRELENVVERAVLLAGDRGVGPEHLQLEPPADELCEGPPNVLSESPVCITDV